MVSYISLQNTMGDNIVLFLFFGLFFGVIAWILLVVLGKFLKGEIKIKIPKRTYSYGETIEGYFTLHAKKTINGDDLSVHLVGYRRENSYGKDGKKNTRRVEVARLSQDIEHWQIYDAWLKRDYNFKIDILKEEAIFGKKEWLEIDLEEAIGWKLWKIAKYALKHIPKTQITWQVQVDLEATGLDIHGKKDIFIQQA